MTNAINQGKCEHDKHHRRITEDHDAVCRRVAKTIQREWKPSRRKQKRKVRQTV